jgi:hypothetical protein
MLNRTALASGIALAAASAVLATNARVESMGENADYYMDDVNIWKNPADANLYPNYLLGELGQKSGIGDSTSYNGLSRFNSDPTNPWFGAVFAKSFAPDGSTAGRYPQFIIGGALNRNDEWLSYMPSAIQIKTNAHRGVLPSGDSTTLTSYDLTDFPVKFDGILGFADASGNLYGLKTYLAYSDSTNGAREVQTVLNTYTLGANLPFGSQYSLEADATLGFLSVDVKDADAAGSQPRSYSSGMTPSFGADARLFIDARPIPIVFVPAASFRYVNAPQQTITSFRVGSGANVSLDRGFFWLGVDYFYNSNEVFASDTTYTTVSDSVSSTMLSDNGIRVSFGIERNIWTDWFVIRVGGQKVINFHKANGPWQNYSAMSTNPDINADNNDLVNFGFGLNIEDKLKVDAVVAKDILFTGGALLGGPVDHVLSRISASYSF